jgi:hypothetical protein
MVLFLGLFLQITSSAMKLYEMSFTECSSGTIQNFPTWS